jgi:hypothetical protein
MSFLEKVKNMFTEEVEDDVKVEQIKKEVTHVAIESPSVNKEDDKIPDDMLFMPPKRENKPVFFDDNDFRDLNIETKPKEEKIEVKEKDVYGSKIQQEKPIEEKKIFKPTPIISPIYGVLDKNYHKEDIVSRNDIEREVVQKESPIDTIRNKAYGTLEDELENTLFGSNSILFKKDDDEEKKSESKEISNEMLTNLTDDISKELEELLMKKEKNVEDNDDKKDNNLEDDDLLGFIDSTLYKDGDE